MAKSMRHVILNNCNAPASDEHENRVLVDKMYGTHKKGMGPLAEKRTRILAGLVRQD